VTSLGLPDKRSARPGRSARSGRPSRVLVGLELFTGATAVTGGLLLAIAPDGSLLALDPAALHGSPFADYRLPGVLLGTLVGGGYLLTGSWQWRAGRGIRALSVCAGVGLVLFEAAELLWLGFQPLEAVFAALGATVAGLALIAGPGPVGVDGASRTTSCDDEVAEPPGPDPRQRS
jgi:hypothetical protein